VDAGRMEFRGLVSASLGHSKGFIPRWSFGGIRPDNVGSAHPDRPVATATDDKTRRIKLGHHRSLRPLEATLLGADAV
jgi:hypothetical protein